MRISASLVIIMLALIAALVSMFGDDGWSRLSAMQRGLTQQQRTNSRLDEQVQALKRQATGLQTDDRAVEKAARSELGMARPDEVIVIFDKKSDQKDDTKRSVDPASRSGGAPVSDVSRTAKTERR